MQSSLQDLSVLIGPLPYLLSVVPIPVRLLFHNSGSHSYQVSSGHFSVLILPGLSIALIMIDSSFILKTSPKPSWPLGHHHFLISLMVHWLPLHSHHCWTLSFLASKAGILQSSVPLNFALLYMHAPLVSSPSPLALKIFLRWGSQFFIPNPYFSPWVPDL